MSAPSSSTGIGSLLTGFTRLSKALSFILVSGFLVSFAFPASLRYVALVPGKTIPYAWNLLTAGFVETSFPTLVVNVLALLFLGKILEPVWGSREFFKFIFIVSTWTTSTTFIVMIILYYLTLKEQYLYGIICGFHGVIAGLLVGIKQLMPDQEIAFLYLIKFRAKWLPSFAVVISTAVSLSTGGSVKYLPFIVLGTYVSWIYLRFYQTKTDAKLKGDLSEEFAFTTFFPEFLRPVIGVLATIVGRLFCGRTTPLSQDGDSLSGTPLPGSDPSEALRRRERGARALEERLNASKANAPSEAGVSDLPVSGVIEDSAV